jgi:hypothetical protein
VERQWKKSKYSVNIEEFSKNNEETTKNNVKSKQLVTLKQSKKDDTLKISDSSADAKLLTRLQLQLTAYKTETDNTKLQLPNSLLKK